MHNSEFQWILLWVKTGYEYLSETILKKMRLVCTAITA